MNIEDYHCPEHECFNPDCAACHDGPRPPLEQPEQPAEAQPEDDF